MHQIGVSAAPRAAGFSQTGSLGLSACGSSCQGRIRLLTGNDQPTQSYFVLRPQQRVAPDVAEVRPENIPIGRRGSVEIGSVVRVLPRRQRSGLQAAWRNPRLGETVENVAQLVPVQASLSGHPRNVVVGKRAAFSLPVIDKVLEAPSYELVDRPDGPGFNAEARWIKARNFVVCIGIDVLARVGLAGCAAHVSGPPR